MSEQTIGVLKDVGAKGLVCVFFIVVAFVVSKTVQVPIKRLLGASEQRKVGGTIFQNIVRVVIWGWAICLIIQILFGIDLAGVLAAFGIAGIAVSLGAQETIANVIGGIIASLSGMIGPGDWITLEGREEARVVDTNWRRTTLEDENGILYAVPNSKLISSIVEKGNSFYYILFPFALKPSTTDVEKLLSDCEQVLLDRMVELEMDYEMMRPKAYVESTSAGAIHAEARICVRRDNDSRTVKRAVLPALIDFLQEHDALAEFSPATD